MSSLESCSLVTIIFGAYMEKHELRSFFLKKKREQVFVIQNKIRDSIVSGDTVSTQVLLIEMDMVLSEFEECLAYSKLPC